MTTPNRDWKAVRIIHLPGGCRAINGLDPKVQFEPDALSGKKATFVTKAYGAIFSDLETLKLELIGADFYSHNLEAKGIIPPDWRAYHRFPMTIWPSEDEAQRWSQIGHAAFSRNNGRLWDVASRISHQLRVCSWRLRQVSESYCDQLGAMVRGGDFNIGTQFADGYTWLAYLSIQAYLVDACVLRDYLAEYYALILSPDTEQIGKNPITSMGGLLRRKVLDNIGCEDSVANALREATSEGGWLHELGAYRDLVVHSAPLARAQGRMFAVATELNLGTTGALPAIRLPIPANPLGITKARTSGEHFEDFARQFELFVRASQSDTASADGMAYAHSALGQLSFLASQLADRSPVPPEIHHYNETNIIGPVKVTNV